LINPQARQYSDNLTRQEPRFTKFNRVNFIAQFQNCVGINSNDVSELEGHSLEEYNHFVQGMSAQNKWNYSLRGFMRNDTKMKIQASLDFRSHVTDHEIISCSMDIDSVIVVVEDLNLKKTNDLKFFPCPNRENTLKTNIHTEVQITVHSLPDTHNIESVSPHTIPNFEIATINNYRVIILLPEQRRMNPGKTRWINICTAETYRIFYDSIARPALQCILSPQMMCHFPLTYKEEFEKGQADIGKMAFAGYKIDGCVVARWVEEMRKIIQADGDLKSFDNFFFLIYMKDMKLTLSSGLHEDVYKAFSTKYPLFEVESDNKKMLFDIGFELMAGVGQTLLWDLKALKQYLKDLGGKTFSSDHWCFSDQAGGMTCEYKSKLIGELQMLYIQAYLLEKEPTYPKANLKGGPKYSFQNAVNNPESYQAGCDLLTRTWENMGVESWGLRIEFRCSMSAGCTLLNTRNNMTQLLIESFVNRRMIIIQTSENVAEFKTYRLQQYLLTITQIQDYTTPKQREDLQLRRIIFVMASFIRCLVQRRPDNSIYRNLWQNVILGFPHIVQNTPIVQYSWSRSTMLLKENTPKLKIDELIEWKAKAPRQSKDVTNNRKYQPTKDGDVFVKKQKKNPVPESVVIPTTELSVPIIFQIFRESLWSLIIKPDETLKDSMYQDEKYGTFIEEDMEEVFNAPVFIDMSSNRTSWDIRFSGVFSETEANAKWPVLAHHLHYRRFMASLTVEERKTARDAMKDLFDGLEVFPNGPNTARTPWKTTMIRINQKEVKSVSFIRNNM
jgi:hypothetical protein